MNQVKVTHWGYRAAKRTVDGEVEWTVREVYFDKAGNPLGWTEPIAASGDTCTELAHTLRRMRQDALSHAPLDLDTPATPSDEEA